ncbi:MAG: hypothetical protein J5506_11250 [Prevotella sp.]|nr:hypothetical protein [Prevotella sp.]
MKRLLTALTALLLALTVHGQGIPFIRNFMVEDYHANNTNFDIETDEHGNVFVANFEGLLYYDHAEWRIIHTPGITRVTIVYKAADNTIWVGGYNYFGKVVRKENGDIALQRIGSPKLFRGEVREIYEQDGDLLFKVQNTKYKVQRSKGAEEGTSERVEVVKENLANDQTTNAQNDQVETVPLADGLRAVVMKNAGLVITDDKNRALYTLTDANGLCSDNVAHVVYDGHGQLWGATDKGIFAIQIPASITRFTSYEGLPGSILAIESFNGRIYAGTREGLCRLEGHRFVRVTDVPHACWALKKSGNSLLVATADGIFRIYPDWHVRHLTTANSMALLDEGSRIYSGETDGIYLIQADGQNRKKVCNLENVRKIVKDNEGSIWAQSLYGAVFCQKSGDNMFRLYNDNQNLNDQTMRTVVMTSGKATVVSAESTKPFPYPLVSYVDDKDVTWLTDNEGKGLYRWKDGKRLSELNQLLALVSESKISAIHTQGNELWLGNDNGLTIINTQVKDPALDSKPKLYIRSVRLNGDSILWGGFGEMPEMLPRLGHKENNLYFTFSLDHPGVAGQALYRYRLDNGNWSAWTTNTSASFANLHHGNYTFHVQARDAFNRVTDISSIGFRIRPPFYLRWYMNVLYLLMLLALVWSFFRLRLRRLEKEKIRLENIVQERSAEVVRLEKMATAGKLTQGLIDRILNPLNYINNFAKLSEGLVRDVKANVEEMKEERGERIEENYEDTMEVLGMLTVNLQKVGEHGQNTTRTLKAMEEMLKDRSGGISPMNLMDVIRQDKEMLHEYYKQEIEQYGIKTVFDDSEELLPIHGNAEQLSKTFMSLLANAVYAVVKKAQKREERGESTQ